MYELKHCCMSGGINTDRYIDISKCLRTNTTDILISKYRNIFIIVQCFCLQEEAEARNDINIRDTS